MTAPPPAKRPFAPFVRRAPFAAQPVAASIAVAADALAATAVGTAAARQVTAATPTVLSNEARQRILEMPKKRKIAMVTDTAEALQRVESSEATKRVAPTVARESASGFVPAPTQANGTTPAMRAMRRSQTANAARKLGRRNIVDHFVLLQKLLQHATTGAIVAETALDLARSGEF